MTRGYVIVRNTRTNQKMTVYKGRPWYCKRAAMGLTGRAVKWGRKQAEKFYSGEWLPCEGQFEVRFKVMEYAWRCET